jgi:dTMP kinase
VFVTFEGIDGCGKSTHVRLLAEALRREGRDVVATREPGGTEIGERIRRLLLHGDHLEPWAEAALFAAARAQLVGEVVRPALERGAIVVSDRFLDSSLAYQGIARGLGLDAVLDLNRPGLGGVMPDRTYLLAVPVAVALSRGSAEPDRIEGEGRGFLELVGRAYLEVAAAFPERILVVDATRDIEAIAAEICEDLRPRLS